MLCRQGPGTYKLKTGAKSVGDMLDPFLHQATVNLWAEDTFFGIFSTVRAYCLLARLPPRHRFVHTSTSPRGRLFFILDDPTKPSHIGKVV